MNVFHISLHIGRERPVAPQPPWIDPLLSLATTLGPALLQKLAPGAGTKDKAAHARLDRVQDYLQQGASELGELREEVSLLSRRLNRLHERLGRADPEPVDDGDEGDEGDDAPDAGEGRGAGKPHLTPV